MSASPPLFSILLPTHNRADVIGASVRSILNQTCQDFEVLAVGDGCTDSTGEVLAAFDDDRIRWFDLPKAPGFGYANRNIALREARGSLIAFAAHDDLMFPDHLAQLAQVFARNPETQWAYCRPLWIDDEGTIMPFYMNLTRDNAYRRFMTQYNSIPAGCVVHRRAAMEKAGMWPEDVERGGDWVLWKRIVSAYGRHSLRFVRNPSHLHFRAHWRERRNWGPRPLPYMKALAEQKPDWPPQLTLALEDDSGPPPQEQVLRLMEAAPAAFAANIRNGVASLQDDLAWEATLDSHFY